MRIYRGVNLHKRKCPPGTSKGAPTRHFENAGPSMMPDHINFDRAPIGQTTSPDHRKCPKGKPVGQWTARSGFSRRALVGHLAPKAGNRADYGLPAAGAHFAEVIPGADVMGLSTGRMRLSPEVAQRWSNVAQRHWLVGPDCATAPLAPPQSVRK